MQGIKSGGIILLCVWSMVAIAIPGLSAVPDQINYQGQLTDDTGAPVPDGTYLIKYSIYDGLSVLRWSETQTHVSVVNGIFNVMLPENPASTPFLAGLFDETLFLGVQVGSDAEMIPRQPLNSVPFAFKAGDADRLEGHISADFPDAGHVHDFADIGGVIADGQVPNNININYAATAGTASSAVTANNADTVDNHHASDFATSQHSHDGSAITAGTVADVRIASSIARDSEIMATILGSDGAGSGLDADFLDGKSAGAFMSAGADNWVNEMGDIMRGRLEVETNLLGTGWGESIKGVLNTSAIGAGVFGLSNGTDSRGVYGGATGQNGIGVYGESSGSSGIGVYGSGPGWAGYFDGDLYTNGLIRIPNNSHIINAAGRQVFHTGWSGLFGDYTTINSGYDWGSGEPVSVVAGSNGVFFTKGDESGIPHAQTLAHITTSGRFVCNVLEIKGGSDLAEPFDTQNTDSIKAGMLMAIDPDNPGLLKVSDRAYDTRVAGVVSGAGGINPGMVMTQEGSPVHGSTPIALSGRVYCLADATHGAIQPGDMLTTSNTPGHAMKADDRRRSYGAVIGKAMTLLEEGTGLVLVLVSLQ